MANLGKLGGLYADMVSATIRNIEETFAGVSADELQVAAQAIWASRQVFVLGVGVNNANARNFTYLASTGMTRFHAIPRAGSTPIDDLAWVDERDVLIAISANIGRTSWCLEKIPHAFSFAPTTRARMS